MTLYGEHHPRLLDDRLKMVLVILDGLGDRPAATLGMKTPAEAAKTPNLDHLASRGVSGIHLPFGPGRAPSSEIAHWAMFGYEPFPFCGRAVLEARGFGHSVPTGRVLSYAALRPGRIEDGAVWITGRAAADDEDDAIGLFDALSEIGLRLRPVRWGEAILDHGAGASPDITDSDPFFEHIHPWLKPQAFIGARDPEEAVTTATRLGSSLRGARALLTSHPINAARRERGVPVLDVLTTKWTGRAADVPSFNDRVGVEGAAVTSSPLYRGLAATLGLGDLFIPPGPEPGRDLSARLDAAATLLAAGIPFVHVHTKATDEAGHAKDPAGKAEVIEALDAAMSRLNEPPFSSSVVLLTGDHATPSRDGVLHSGDPTPLVAAGPTVAADDVSRFGETHGRTGSLGALRASDLLPVMLGFANRPAFLGTRITPHPSLGLPDHPRAMPVDTTVDGHSA